MDHLETTNNIPACSSILVIAHTELDRQMYRGLLENELGEKNVFTSNFAIDDVQPELKSSPHIVLFFSNRETGTYQISMSKIATRWPTTKIIVVLSDLRSLLDLTGNRWPICDLVLKDGGMLALASAISSVRMGCAFKSA